MYSNSPSQVITCFNMRDRLERFVLLPFNAGCISESSIPVVIQHTKRPKFYTDSTPTRKRDEEKDEEEDYLDIGSLSGEYLKTALPRLQKLFKNLSRLFVYKDEMEAEIGMEIGVPTDVKHVTHIGLDGCATSFFSERSWENISAPELIDMKQLELAMSAQDETPNVKCSFHDATKNSGKLDNQ
ncbi:hypothetical protein ABFS82_06G203500 [Erythranthe guttata]